MKYNSVSDRSGNPATQHVSNAETGIYEKFAMLRCRLKRRARPIAKRRGTPLTSVPYLLTSRRDAVNNVNVYKDAVRAQLELQKQQAKSQWVADAAQYIQAELQVFLATLSQNTGSNVTSTNTNSVQTINPTVQAATTTPVTQNTNPAQAAQSYYQGVQVWDTKWQDLLTKQNTWEQNSLNAIQNGILQWNQSITGLENDKLTYLNGIEQTKAQWLANKQIITNAQNQMRGALQSTITNIRSQENQLKANASGDASLTSVFGDMDELLDDLQDALNTNASLGTLAQTLGNFSKVRSQAQPQNRTTGI
ncbi:hypothetical protein LEP1GSC086_1625 [Leptospira weilii str. LNT 1234]|nr:hypothetical protein LEP1GSC086_1625 [Leptospira weilii str. LNT 1234]